MIPFCRRRCRLAHHGDSDHQTKRVKCGCGLVAIGIREQSRLKNPIVLFRRNAISYCVARMMNQQIVRVIGHNRFCGGRTRVKTIAIAAW